MIGSRFFYGHSLKFVRINDLFFRPSILVLQTLFEFACEAAIRATAPCHSDADPRREAQEESFSLFFFLLRCSQSMNGFILQVSLYRLFVRFPFEVDLRVTMGCAIHSVFEYAMEIYDFFYFFCSDCSSFPIHQASRELFPKNCV